MDPCFKIAALYIIHHDLPVLQVLGHYPDSGTAVHHDGHPGATALHIPPTKIEQTQVSMEENRWNTAP